MGVEFASAHPLKAAAFVIQQIGDGRDEATVSEVNVGGQTHPRLQWHRALPQR